MNFKETSSYAGDSGGVRTQSLDADEKARLISELMLARRAKKAAIRTGNASAGEAARQRIDAAKVALGERGTVWWTDAAPDRNRCLARSTEYAAWFEDVSRP